MNLPPRRVGSEDTDIVNEYPLPIYFGDDLTKKRANLAFTARKSKTAGLIEGTWVSVCKILIKDHHQRFYEIKTPADLKNHEQKLEAVA